MSSHSYTYVACLTSTGVADFVDVGGFIASLVPWRFDGLLLRGEMVIIGHLHTLVYTSHGLPTNQYGTLHVLRRPG